MNKRLRKLLAGMLAVVMLAGMLPAALAAEGEDTTTITIIGTSDTHGNVWGYSYEDNKESAGGLAAISTYMKALRAENDNVILVDNGDTIQGTIMTDDLFNKNPDRIHPVISAMNYMQYDAMGLGNHEFNWGMTAMEKIVSQAEMPVLCANIRNGEGELVTGKGWTIVERSGVQVAIIAVATPNIQRWDGGKDGIDELDCRGMAEGVREALDEIIAAGGADVYFVAAHAGLEPEYSTNGNDAAKTILELCPEVTALQCGHTHTTYVNNEGPVPVGEATNGAGEVVRFDITLDADKKVVDAKVEVVSVKDQAHDADMRALETIQGAHEETVEYVVGNVLGHASEKFQPENEIAGIPQGKLEDTAVMDLINTIQMENAGADVSAAALFKDTSDLPEGDLNYGNVFDIYKYDNTLYRVSITGAQLKEYMEWSVSHYNTWVPGDINVSFNPAIPGYRYDMFSGVDYEINLSKPEGERIENVMFKGEPLQDDQVLKLAVNNYRFSSAVKAMVGGDEAKEWESSQSIRDMIVAYMAENDPMVPTVDNNWKITGVDLSLDNEERAAYVEKINAGELATPYYDAINLNEANNVLLDGTVKSAATVNDGDVWFRLRDMATILAGTDLAFDVTWNAESAQVEIVRGGEYTAEALEVVTYEGEAEAATLAVLVDGETVEVAAVLKDCNYYISAEGLNALVGTAATQADGVMSLSATNTTATGVGG